jgi:hypothetical protein
MSLHPLSYQIKFLPIICTILGIHDLIYTIEHESLQCNVHFTKLIVTSEDIVLDCTTVGAVHENIVVPYVGAMFVGGENNALCTIDRIQSGTAFVHTFIVKVILFTYH